MAMLEAAQPYRQQIFGLGLYSVEESHPPVKFQEAYDRARAEGYRLTAHCDVDMVDAVRHIWHASISSKSSASTTASTRWTIRD